MSIRISEIMESIARDIDRSYTKLKKEGMRLDIPEVEIKLNLEVELEGKEERAREIKPPGKPTPLTKFLLTEEIFKKEGIAFKTIATPAVAEENPGTTTNFEIRFIVLPKEIDE